MALEEIAGGAERTTPPAAVIYGLSDLSPAQIEQFLPIWQTLDDGYRYRIMRALAETSEADFEMEFSAVGRVGLNDPADNVRLASIDVLWEDESVACMQALMNLAANDTSTAVRASATSALGRFMLKGEYGEIPEDQTQAAVSLVTDILLDESLDVEIRRRALEALSNSSSDILAKEIRKAYRSGDHGMQVSSVFAMGRSSDSQWEDIVLKELDSHDAEMRYEAARACGELTLVDAVPKLARLLVDDDREIQEVGIWALGEIGGKQSIRILEDMRSVAEERNDDVLVEAIEDAIANATFMDSGMFGWFDTNQ
jgi:hypothetical protein